MKNAIRDIGRKTLALFGYDSRQLRRKDKRDTSVEISELLHERASRRHNKIFGIGHNKTATSTLNEVFKIYGFDVPDQGRQERCTTAGVYAGDYRALKKFVEKYDTFQDLPFSEGMTYVACDALFPGSKFILTIRSEDAWYKSIYNFHRRGFGFQDRSELSEDFFKGKNLNLDKNYVYEFKKRFLTSVRNGVPATDWGLLYDEAYYKAEYNRRNAEIIRYFAGRPNDLLVIDITQEKDTSKICAFLGIDQKHVVPMPHINKT